MREKCENCKLFLRRNNLPRKAEAAGNFAYFYPFLLLAYFEGGQSRRDACVNFLALEFWHMKQAREASMNQLHVQFTRNDPKYRTAVSG